MRDLWMGLAAAAVVVAAPVVSAAAASWSWLNAADDRFAVELPGTPTVKRWDQDIGGGLVAPTVEYRLIAGGDEFMVGAANFKADPSEEQLKVGFAASVDALVAAEKGTQTWRRSTTVSGRAAVEAEYSHVIGRATYRTRVLITFGGQRLYTMTVRQLAEAPVSTADRAVRSLRLL